MINSRDIKIIARHVIRESTKFKTDIGKINYFHNMELMIEELGGNVHEYKEIVDYYTPQMRLDI